MKAKLAASLFMVALNASAATYYVRPDGGDAARCNGTADAPVASSPNCAWSSVLVALPSGGTARFTTGDTLRVSRGTYRMGFGAPGAEKCSSHYPWDCTNARIPNGAKIIGDCAVKPKLTGVERVSAVLALGDSSNVEVVCLEITDGATCGELLGTTPCKRDAYPFGPWASNGITARGARGVVLRDLHIHGLAGRGITAGGIADWTLQNVRIIGNAWAGWEGDIGSGSSNSGAIAFNGGEIAWNGCIETLTGAPGRCYAQMQGGYGDGLGTAATGGAWSFVGVNVHHNTSDGIDLLYANGSGSITVRNSLFASNAGNQLKTNGPAVIESNRITGDCGWFSRNTMELIPGDHCRAAGNVLSLSFTPGAAVALTNNDVSGEGDCLVLANGAGTLTATNNRFTGGPQYGGGDTTCGYYTEGAVSVWSGNTWSAVKAGTAPANAADAPVPTVPAKVEIPAQSGKKLVCEWVDAA